MASFIIPDYHAEYLLSQLKIVGDEQPVYRVLEIPFSKQIKIVFMMRSKSQTIISQTVTKYESFFINFWPLKNPLNELLQRIIQHGIDIHFDKRHRQLVGLNDERPSTGLNIEASTSSITMLELKFIIIVSGVGLLLSVVVFILELLLTNRKQLMIRLLRTFKRA